MKNYLLVNRALVAEKNINYFNNLFSRVKEHSSPTVNRRSTDGQSQRQYSIGIWKYVAMMALLLTLGIGEMWAYWYIPGSGWTWNVDDGSKMNGQNYITYYALPAGTYTFKVAENSGGDTHWFTGNPTEGSDANNVMTITKGANEGDNNTLVLTETADVQFDLTNETYKDVTVNAYPPTYFIKYPFGGGDWTWYQLYADGTGTYSVRGNYSGSSSTGYNYRKRTSNSDTWKSDATSAKVTLVNSPSSTSDYCIFTYDPSTDNLTIRKCNTVTKTNYIYVDNGNSNWSQDYMYFVIGRPQYSKMYRITQISNTQMWYVAQSADSWTDCGYYAIAGGSSAWDNGTGWGPSSLSGWDNRSAPYLSPYNLANGKTYLVGKANSTNDEAITFTEYSGYSGLNNCSQTIKYALSVDGGTTYTDMSSGKTPGQISISTWYKYNGNGTVNSQSAQTASANGTNYSKTATSAGYRAKVILTESSTQTGYVFVGWYVGNVEKNTTTSYTYYPSEALTVTARFKAKGDTLTLNPNSGSGGSSSAIVYYNTKNHTSITNPTRSGYEFAGWYSASGGTGTLVIDKYGRLQPYSAHTNSDSTWNKTSNQTLYAGWLKVHSPGAYTDTYGKDLTMYSSAQYELYGFSKTNSSATYRITAGERVNVSTDYSSAANKVLTFNGTTFARDANGWMEGNYQTESNVSGPNSNEFSSFPTGSMPTLKIKGSGHYFIQMYVSGYSGFDILAKDANTSTDYVKVEVDGKDVTANKSTTAGARNYTLTTGTHLIRISAIGSSACDIYGFSLKVPCAAFTVSRGGQENGTYTVGSYDGNALTCTPSASGTYTYQWKQYTSGQGVGDTINAVGSGANTNSFTPNPASAGTYYYMCRVLNACGDKQVSSTTGTFVFSAPSTFTVSASVNPSGYGTLSTSSISEIASGTSITAASNVLTIGASSITATKASSTTQWSYAFTNWTKSDGTALPSTVTSDLSVYANFSRTGQSYTVTLDKQVASNSPTESVSATYGSAMPSIGTLPTHANYTFGGFYTQVAGGGTCYYNGSGTSQQNSDFEAAGTLYAKFTQSVTLDKNGGTKNGSATATYAGTVGSISAPTYTGHTVDGYYAESGCSNKVMTAAGVLQESVTDGSSVVWTDASSKWKHAAASTLYAHWKCDAPTITDNGDYTVSISVPSGTTVRYTTDGTTPSSSEGTVYSSAFTVASNCTVKAVAYQTGCTDSEMASRSITLCTPVFGSVTFDNNKSEKRDISYNTSTDVEVIGTATWTQSGVSSDTGHPMTKPAMKLDSGDDYIKITLPSGITSGTITIQACTYKGDAGTLIINDENNSTTPLASAEVGQKDSKAYYMVNSPDGDSWTAPTLKTLTYSSISAGGDFYIKKSSGANIYVYAFSATSESACPKPTITATRLTAEYMPTGSSGVQIGVAVTGASTGWKYRVKNKNGGYETPDNNTYSTSTWTMTSTIGTGANTYKVELYDNSATPVKKAVSSVITVYGEVAYPMTISAGDGGSVSPTSTQANGAGDHLHPTITATPSSGYHFVNWTLSNGNATLDDATSATTTISSASGACTITANFAVDGYTVTYADGGATGGSVPTDASSPYVSGATVTVLGNSGSLTKTGYTFNGWSDGVNTYKAGDTFTITADVTLTAQWTVNYHDLTWNLGGGTTSTVGTGIESGVSTNTTTSQAYGTNLTAPTVTKTGYTFSAWSPGVAGTMPDEDVTYTATWTAKTTTITIDANTSNHGSTAPSPITATYGSALPSFTAATGEAGYSLKGYYTDAIGGTKVIDADGTFSANSGTWNRTDGATLELFAQYEDASYGVTHTLSYVTKSSGATTATHGTNYTAVFAAADDYELPASITVTIGGEDATEDTEYTWDSSTGTIEITGSYITGAIVITVTGEEEGDCTPSRLAKVTLTGGDKNVSVADSACTDSHTLEKTGKIGSSGFLQITPLTALKSGDVVTVTINVGNYSESRLYMRYGGKSSTDTVSVLTNQTSGKDATVSFTLTKDSARISFTRATGRTSDNTEQNHILKSVIISRPCAETTYELTWNTNGGSELVCTGTCTSGDLEPGTTLVAPTDPTLSNYTFDGWKTANDGTGSAAAATMPSADTEYFAAWKQTVTLKTGAQGSGADQTPYVYINGTGVNSFTAHTADGYTLQGYYTAGSGGVKVLNADGTFAAANVTDYITSSKWSRTGAAPTLYAQWVASEDCRTLKYAWKITGNFCDDSTSVTAKDTVRFPANASNLYFTESGTGNTVSAGSSYNIGKTKDNYFLLTAKSGYQIKSICFYGKVEDSSVDYTTDNSTWSELKSTKTGGDDYYSFSSIDASYFGIKLTATSPKGIWIRNMVIEVCAEGGTTYNVTYDGNDKTSGSAPTDATNYSYSGTVTVLGNTGSLAKTNYTFAGWTTNDDGTGSSYEAGSTFSITDNTTLYAKWTQAVTFDANTENHGSTGGSATAVWNATGLTGITHATPASGYKLLGYYTAATSGTKVLNSDGSFAETDVTDYITDGKWSRTGTTTLYAQYEVAGSLTWNLVINSDTTSLTTSSKASSFTEILNSNMTNAALVGLDYLSSDRKKKSLTGKISTPTSFDEDKYVSVSFVVADGYKFTPSSAKVIIQPVSTSSSDVKIILSDGTRTITQTKDNLAKGNKDTVTLTNSDATKYMVGTVTMKIYVYGDEDTYRLGTPITIEGEVEEACATMPDYTSMSYTTLDYTIGDTPGAISIVGGENIDTYTWMQNTTNDRTSGSAVSTGTGYDTYSFTPSIASAGTTYYWCEMTNTDCGITIKSSAVAVTVSASKTNPTVTWDPKAKLNGSDTTAYYGGKDYTIKATLNSGWNGTLTADMMTAPAGIRLHDFTIDNSSNPKTIQATFDVQTGFNVDENDSIAFTLSLPETATYNALNSQKKVAYNVCSGGGSADEYLMPVDAAHIDNDSWKGAWAYEGTGMMCYGHGSSAISAGTKDANLKTLTHSMADGEVTRYYKSSASHFGFYTEKAITGVRMYVYTSNTKSTVSGVYISNSASSSSTPSTGAISYEAEYYNDDDGLLAATNDGCTWVEITFANEVPAGKYGQINVSNNVYIAGIALISGSGAGASQTTTLGFASASVSKTQSDANFTYLATTSGENANTLGAITYSSSNTSCATVNATTGEVDITATGSSERSTTITATLAASGCFKGATATYTLTVAGQSCDINAGTLAITAGEATKCAGDNVTLSLSGHTTDGTTVTWYRGETDVTENVSGNALTTSDAGTYSVVVTKDACTVRSNAVTITNKSAEALVSKLVDEWYIKQGRLTPDVALFDVADATSWTVKKGKAATAIYTSDGTTTTTGLAGVGFKQVDNIVYLEGTAPTGIDAAANDTIIITVIDACGNSATSDSIVIHKQIATDKHVLAFVVTGTEKGGFTAGLAAEQTTELQLYKTLTKNFDVVATNIYSTDDEQKLKEYYSQFDILCITDYPNTKTKGVNSKSYVDAIGSLIDIRPILTMEAWVSGLTNWKSKGISGTPHSPSTRQYSMLLQCKDHEIFAGTSLTKIGEGDETMYRVTMVDQTIEEYPTLDGYTPGSKAYDAGGKPALQGFEYTSAMSDLLPIGRIDDGAGNNLQVGIERQHEMEARLLVLGINSYAMERLTVDGEKVVVNALKYLMKKDAEDISDCSVYFDDASGDHKWNNPENWGPSYKTLPLSTQEVRIYKPCIVDTVVRAASVKIIPDGKYSHGAATADGKLTIAPTGALIVDGKIYAATAPNFYEKRTTTPDDLVLEANAENTGTLIFDNEDGETQATVEMYSKSYWEESGGKYLKYWSYVGMPIKDVHIPEYFYGAFTYYYNETAGWEKRYDEDIMQPFEGIGLAMQEGHKETFMGTLASTENVDLKLTSTAEYGGGDNLVSNSWTAPIQISNFDAEDFGTCWAAVYIYNTGRLGRTYVNATAENDGAATAGQWLGIPIGVAGLPEYSGLKVIPAMQGFLVHDTVPTATTLHLDYNKLVRDGADTISQINQPMRAPKQARPKKKKDVDGLLRIRVTGLTTYTDVWMMQDARFSDGYDNGWDAYYSKCDNRSAQLYARSQAGKMAFLAQADLDGTVLGFAPSRDGNDYTFTFQYRGEDEYYLNDLKLQQSVLIDGEGSYSFTYEKGDTNRFYISRTPLQAPQTPTGIGNTEGTSTQSTKAIKVIYNDKLYIIRGGRVYGADGSLVK